MAGWHRLAIAALTASVAGCFSPSLPADLRCQNDFICPEGFFCDPDTFICRSTSGDGDGDDDAGADADPGSDAITPSAFCDDEAIALCLEFENTIADGSRSNRMVSVLGGATPIFDDGFNGRGLRFNGVYYLDIDPYRGGAAEETFEMWMTVPDNAQEQVAAASEAEFEVSVQARTAQASSGGETIVSLPLETENMHHIAVRVSGQAYELFVDGIRIDGVPFSDGSATPALTLGAESEGTDAYVGTIDSVRAWTRALSPSEIAEIAGEGD